MSSKRYDICTPREGSNGKTYWTRIGSAFEGDKGIQLVFDALPIADSKGRVVANLFEPRERGAEKAAGAQNYGAARTGRVDADPDFAPF
jgi:hypothetical protein